MKIRPRVLLLTLSCLLLAAAARAQPAPCSGAKDSKAFLQECRAKAQAEEAAGRLPEALRTYQETYRKVPTPRILWPMARLHLRLNQPQEGLEALGRYLTEMPPEELPLAERQEAARLKRELEQLRDQPEPPPAPLQVDLVRTQPVAPPPPRFRVWKWVALGAGLALIGGGAGLWAIDGRPTCDIEPADIRCPKILSTGAGAITLVTFGAAAVVGGVVMIALDARSRRAR